MIEFKSEQPQLIVVQFVLTTQTKNKQAMVFHFKEAKVQIDGFPFKAVAGKIILYTGSEASNREVISSVDSKGKSATMWAQLKRQ
jgi:hypothetical protein